MFYDHFTKILYISFRLRDNIYRNHLYKIREKMINFNECYYGVCWRIIREYTNLVVEINF